MIPKLIKTKRDHAQALVEIDRLMELEPLPGSPEANALELLAHLVEEFERTLFPPEMPSVADAILHRLDQLGLTRRDLGPFIGSRSKVSEVLAGKRPLSLRMIRALHTGLGISAETLLQEPGAELPAAEERDWRKFPLQEMVRRGYVRRIHQNLRDHAEDLVREFLAPFGGAFPPAASLRRTSHVRGGRASDDHALLVWATRAIQLAAESEPSIPYRPGSFTPAAIRGLTSLTRGKGGPSQARDALGGFGIGFVVEPHFPRTYLDGALLLGRGSRPIVALSLRHDRIDSFWFTLFHELAHLALHEDALASFFDDLDSHDDRRVEREADALAAETLVPRAALVDSGLLERPDPAQVESFATGLGVHPAIVAGRIRHETGNFRVLSRMLGRGQVRSQFGIG